MSISLSNEKLYQIHDVLKEISSLPNLKINVNIMYKMAKILQNIEDHLVILEKLRHSLLERFNISADTLNKIKESKENKSQVDFSNSNELNNFQEFMKEWSVILETKEDFDIDYFSIDELNFITEYKDINVFTLKRLLPLIK